MGLGKKGSWCAALGAIACLLLTATSAQAETWTVLIYWGVDNELHKPGIPYLAKLQQIGSNDRLNIVAEIDYPRTKASPQKRTERIQIFKEGSMRPNPRLDLPYSRVLKRFDQERNSADPEVLKDFLLWGVREFPADRYLVVIGSHGMNWRGIIEDRTSRKMMPLEGFKSALQAMNAARRKPLDLLVMDACRMAFADTAFVLQGEARWMVASQSDVNGFNHGPTIAELAEHPDMSAQELGRAYVGTYPHADHAEPHLVSSLLKMSSRSVSRWDSDFSEVTAHIASLTARQKASLRDLLTISRNEFRDRAIDFGNLLSALEWVASPLPSRIREITRRYLTHRVETDPSDGSVLYSGFPADSLIQGSSFTAGSRPATGLALNCPANLLDYRKTPVGLLHADWLELCRELGI